jgi:hypothetical protein
MSVFRGSDQSRETRRGIKVRKAKPVDRTLLGDQCGSVAVADQGVIFDGNRQELPSAKIEIELTRAPKLVWEASTTLPGLPSGNDCATNSAHIFSQKFRRSEMGRLSVREGRSCFHAGSTTPAAETKSAPRHHQLH